MGSSQTRAFLAAAACVGLAGCSAAPAAPTDQKQYVVTNSTECSIMTGLGDDVCGALIEQAVKVHTDKSQRYPRLALCEKTEGVDHCERLEEKQWIARPQGFLVTTAAKKHEVKILYAGKDRAKVFRTADNTVFDPDKLVPKIEYSDTAFKRIDAFAKRR